MKDYYQVLGVSRDATPQQIKTSFRELAFKFHPDRCKDASGTEQMKAVNEAYAVLSNPQKRKQYDSLHNQYGDAAYNHFRSAYSEQDIFNGSDIRQIFEEMARSFGIRGFDAIFKDTYGQNYKTFQIHKPGMKIQGVLFSGVFGMPFLNLSSAKQQLGKTVQNLLQKSRNQAIPAKGADYHDVIYIDQELARNGGPYAYYLRSYSRKLVVQIPPGIREGQKIRLTGMGESGKNGMPSGDLFLKISLRTPLSQKIKTFLSSKIDKLKS